MIEVVSSTFLSSLLLRICKHIRDRSRIHFAIFVVCKHEHTSTKFESSFYRLDRRMSPLSIVVLCLVALASGGFTPEREFEIKQGGLLNDGRTYTYVEDHRSARFTRPIDRFRLVSLRLAHPTRRIRVVSSAWKMSCWVWESEWFYWTTINPSIRSSINWAISTKSRKNKVLAGLTLPSFFLHPQMESLRCQDWWINRHIETSSIVVPWFVQIQIEQTRHLSYHRSVG